MKLTADVAGALSAIVISLSFASSVRAQVSPGPLSKAHHSLDSPLKCNSCHVFGAGERKLKCLPCHGEILALVRGHEGYHGHVANTAKGDVDCVRCHTEHYGENFRIYKWETSKDEFDHRQTGYPLLGKHTGLKCEQCHNAKHISAADRRLIKVQDLSKTFEGLHPACLTCHEDLHKGQLGTDCEKCHSVSAWKPVTSFDHSKTKYPLTGKHHDLECAKCHRPTPENAKVIQYTGIPFESCTPCHQDPHHGAFKERCDSCHDIDVWKRVKTANGFDHATTKFPLDGKHRDVACLKCHKDSNFKTLVPYQKCMDCHKDPHKAQFLHRADGGECGSCHTVQDWKKTTYTVASHLTTKFPITGKHQGVACDKCHPPAPVPLETDYHPKFQNCQDCHKDPHNGQFAAPPRANRCEGCHAVTSSWNPATYSIREHQSSRFALKSAHAAVTCLECHQKGGPESKAHPEAGWTFHFDNLKCVGCHRDPHSGDFPAALTGAHAAVPDVCESCHGLLRWQQVKPFDHNGTDYPLTGAHQAVKCLACHRPVGTELATRLLPFKVPSRQCDACHEDIHEGQFRGKDETQDCARCHTTTRWLASQFDHEKGSTFSLRGAHQDVPCALCHKVRENAAGRKVAIYKGTPHECKACHP